MQYSRLAVLVTLALSTAGCATVYTGAEVGSYMNQALEAAELRSAQGDTFEGFQIAEAMRAVDPDFPGLPKRFTASEEMRGLFDRPFLGSNVAQREPIDAGFLTRVLWYIPDRVLDLLDIVSFDLHVGPGLFVDVHATRIASVGLGGRTVVGIGWHSDRSLGIQTQTQAAALVPLLGFEGYSAFKAGTSGARGGHWSIDGIQKSSELLYGEYRDYWSVGAAVTAGFVGADADIHLFQIVDFAVGLLMFDPANDDFGRTTSIDLSEHERRMIEMLRRMSASEESMDHYRVWAESNVPGRDEPATDGSAEAETQADQDSGEEPEAASPEGAAPAEDAPEGETPDGDGADGQLLR